MRNLDLYITTISDETNWSPGHPSFLGTVLVLYTTHLWIDFGFLLAVLKKNTLALAMCSLIFILDFCFYVYLFIHFVYDDELGQDDRRTSILQMLGIIAMLHFNGWLYGTLCIQHFRCQNQKSQGTKLPLIDDTASDQYVLLMIWVSSIPIRIFLLQYRKYIYFWLQLFA